VLVLRAKTERPEGVAAGTVKLVGTDPDTILNAMTGLFDDEVQYQRMAGAINPYGDGCAAVRIVKHLLNGV
jgi:UDP-N-acetylglucosamine 2-epimerase (non-hydrolysing)